MNNSYECMILKCLPASGCSSRLLIPASVLPMGVVAVRRFRRRTPGAQNLLPQHKWTVEAEHPGEVTLVPSTVFCQPNVHNTHTHAHTHACTQTHIHTNTCTGWGKCLVCLLQWQQKWHMIVILLNVKDGAATLDVCVSVLACVWVFRWMLLFWLPRPPHTCDHNGKVLDLREAFREMYKWEKRWMWSESCFLLEQRITDFEKRLTQSQLQVFAFSARWSSTPNPFSLSLMIIRCHFDLRGEKKQLSGVSNGHTCCHCYHWFNTQSCPKRFYRQFSSATDGVQGVIITLSIRKKAPRYWK